MQGTELFTSLVGSVTLLLWGVRMVRTGVTRTLGGALRRLLAAFTSNRFYAFASGLVVTVLVQSSTATALLLGSFCGRGMIGLAAALAVMLGANVGTALAAQIFSFDVLWLWSAVVAIGVILFMSSSAERPRGLARSLIGLGLMLLALDLMTSTIDPLKGSPTFRTVIGAISEEPIPALLAASILTWLAHSSLSIVLFVKLLASTGAVPTEAGFALVLGANLGGAIAPFLDLSGSPPAARRVPLGNLLMRGAAVILILPALSPLAHWSDTLGIDPGRLMIDFHLAFNVVAAIVSLLLTDSFAKVCARLVPEPRKLEDLSTPRHLDPNVLDNASEALACAMRETLNMGDRVSDMLRQALVVFENSDVKLMRDVEKSDNAVDRLHEAIKLYLIDVSRSGLSEEESRRFQEILSFTTNLEHIGDIIDKNLMELAAKKIKNNYVFSSEGLQEIKKFHGLVMDELRLALNVFATRDVTLARKLISEKSLVRAAERDTSDRHYARLRDGRPESIASSAIHLDIIRDLKRINSHLASVGYPILEEAGELAESRLLAREKEQIEAPSNGQALTGPSRV
ncbi:MAG: Na/Pi cotransporter family protein [Hyphomicrobiales bacterium]|nr:Na/Pi cotransporter family protein [Hyphomicrobiales bacterium]